MAVCVKFVSGTLSSSTQILTIWQPGTMANPRILGSSFGSVVPETKADVLYSNCMWISSKWSSSRFNYRWSNFAKNVLPFLLIGSTQKKKQFLKIKVFPFRRDLRKRENWQQRRWITRKHKTDKNDRKANNDGKTENIRACHLSQPAANTTSPCNTTALVCRTP